MCTLCGLWDPSSATEDVIDLREVDGGSRLSGVDFHFISNLPQQEATSCQVNMLHLMDG